MPNVKIPTGVDLYYESHGQGEPLILVPSTALGRGLETVADATGNITEFDLS